MPNRRKMFKWLVLLGALLVVQLATANSQPIDRRSLGNKARQEYASFLRFAIKEIRGLFESVLAEPKNAVEFEEDIKEYKNFLEMTKDYENMDHHNVQFFVIAAKLIPFDIMGTIKNGHTFKGEHSLAFQNYEKFLSVAAIITQRQLEFTVNLGYQVRDYLKALSAEEKKNELQLIYWFDDWMHLDLSEQMRSKNQFFDIFLRPRNSGEVYAEKLLSALRNYLQLMREIIQDVNEEKFITKYESIAEPIDREHFGKIPDLIAFYKEFNDWLIAKGPSHFKHTTSMFRTTVNFFDKIEFYSEFYFAHADVKPEIRHWYAELQKAESFEEKYAKYLEVF